MEFTICLRWFALTLCVLCTERIQFISMTDNSQMRWPFKTVLIIIN